MNFKWKLLRTVITSM